MVDNDEMEQNESDVIILDGIAGEMSKDFQDNREKIHECMMFLNESKRCVDKDKSYYQKIRQRMRMLVHETAKMSSWRNQSHEKVSVTPSCKKAGKQDTVPQTSEAPAQLAKDLWNPQSNVQHAFFVTSQASGVLDLGASQTVIGQQQVPEFLQSLPEDVRSRVFESPANMTFRFGNNSTVPCRKMMYVPVDKYWLKIAIVESHTPFLLSNNVCRSFGAVIDTEKEEIFFRKLQCTMPLTLSGKKLFTLNVADLVTLRPPVSTEKMKAAVGEHAFAQVFEERSNENVNSSKETVAIAQGSLKDSDCSKETPLKCRQSEKYQVRLADAEVPSTVEPRNVQGLEAQTDSPIPSSAGEQSHDRCIESRKSLSEHPGGERTEGEDSRPSTEIIRRASEYDHPFRQYQSWNPVPSSGTRRSQVLPMVSQEMGSIHEAGTCGVHLLSQDVDRKDGAQREHRCQAIQEGSDGQLDGCWKGHWEVCSQPSTSAFLARDIGRGRRDGSQEVRSAVSPQSPGECAFSGCRTAASLNHAECSKCSGQESSRMMDSSQTAMIESCIKEYNHYFQNLGKRKCNDVDCEEPSRDNPIWHEMMDRFEVLKEKHPHRRISNSQLDVLEVYCSSESNLTKQCLGRDLKSMRFGLKQGDLSNADGRQRLYDVLFFLRPKHVWMSPKCKAWCKWSQFNAARSLEGARKVMIAREEDEIHLQLCEAVFWNQVRADEKFHFHLEQPIGSDMLGEDPLQSICDHTLKVRCDLCTAGNLCHPTTKVPMQKGTQIITTSQIMAQYMSQYRCKHEHTHTDVAGQYVRKDGTRGNVSEATELYTPIFANRLARVIAASLKCNEKSIVKEHMIFGESLELDGNEGSIPESDLKRRRLGSKVSRPPAFYPEPVRDVADMPRAEAERAVTLDEILKECMKVAPRVGTMVLEEGPLFELIQRHFSEHQIRLIEVCKGADRFRKPPVRLTASEFPWRKSFGLHRHNLTVEDAGEWEDWRTMSNRQLCSKSPPFRVLVTVFARKKADVVEPRLKRNFIEDSDERVSKKPRGINPSEPAAIDASEETKASEDLEKMLSESTCQHGQKFLELSKEEKQWISKIHHNLGHPGPTKLQMVLKQQGYAQNIVDAIADFRCSTCHELQNPKIARPSALSESREFNDCVGCDAVVWASSSGKSFTFLHFIDMATNFQQGCVVNRMDADSLFEAFQNTWLHWAGPCKQMIIDNDSALCSERFSQLAQEQNIHLRVVAAYAHWQMGKTERHGEIVQQMLAKYDHEKAINTEPVFQQVLVQCFNAKNSLARAKGYTPEILVLGKSRELPGSISDDSFSPSQYTADSNTPEGIAFREHLSMREVARKAFLSADNDEKLRRAFLRRHRPHRGHVNGGTFVMFWRPGRGENPGFWSGPARVIIQESEHVVWLSFSSRVYRVAPEHVRCLSEREAETCMHRLAHEDMKTPSRVGQRGVFQYEDLASIPNMRTEDGSMSSPPTAHENLQRMPTPESQPDAEPELPPPESPSYMPTTPSEGLRSVEEEPVDPSSIPVPEDLNDELVMEDFWVQEEDRIVRVHRKPRFVAFDPSTTTDCPVPILHLNEERETQGNHADGTSWKNVDSWGCENSRWLKQATWTGQTVFHVCPHAGEATSDDQDVLHVEPTQCFEMEIFLTTNDLNKMHSSSEDFVTLVSNAAKRQHVEVKLKDLNENDVIEFNAAKEKEINQWIETSTIRKILRSRIPEKNILRCRWVLTWKQLDSIDAQKEGKTRKAKARLVVRGFEDPDLTELARDSPTLQKESRALILQLCASRRWTIKSFDIRTAFLRGSRRDNRVLAIDPPPEMRQHMQLKETEVGELLKSAYGLVNAPYLWYQELRECLLSLGFQVSPLDPCLFSLSDSKGHVRGIVGMHVDDGLCCGDDVFELKLKEIEKRFPFGSKREKNFKFTGINIEQDENANIHLNQKEYILAIEPISIERSRRKQEQMEVNEKERQELRGLIGSLQYAATNTRPDLAARLSFLQSTITTAKIHDLLECNRLLGEAKKFSDVKVTISNIPEEKIRFVSYSDASFATRAKQQSQKGGLFLATHSDVFQQTSALSSPLTWYSKKIERVVASTLAAETYALSAAVDMLDWLRLSWEWLRNASTPWRQPEAVWKNSSPSIAVVDCKSLYDVITKTTTPQCQEHRTLIEALIIKDHLQSGIKPYWVHSAAQLADALTKAMDCFRLREFLRHRTCCLHDIDEVLKARADHKAKKNWLRNEFQKSAKSESEVLDQQINFINFGECDLYAFLKQIA